MNKYKTLSLIIIIVVAAIVYSRPSSSAKPVSTDVNAGILRLVGESSISCNWKTLSPLYTCQNKPSSECCRDVFQQGGFIVQGKCTMLIPKFQWMDPDADSCVYMDKHHNIFMYFRIRYSQLLLGFLGSASVEYTGYIKALENYLQKKNIQTLLGTVKKLRLSKCQILVPYEIGDVVYAVYGQKLVCAFYR
jgi:hypothetical protein